MLPGKLWFKKIQEIQKFSMLFLLFPSFETISPVVCQWQFAANVFNSCTSLSSFACRFSKSALYLHIILPAYSVHRNCINIANFIIFTTKLPFENTELLSSNFRLLLHLLFICAPRIWFSERIPALKSQINWTLQNSINTRHHSNLLKEWLQPRLCCAILSYNASSK